MIHEKHAEVDIWSVCFLVGSEVNTPASGTGNNKNAAPGKTFYFHGLIIIVGIINNSFLI